MAAAVAAVTLPGAAAAAPPSGFYEARVLEPAASFVAGKPARIFCAVTLLDWRDYAKSVGTVGDANAVTMTIGGNESQLRDDVCSNLRAGVAGRPVGRFALAASVLILVHESIHQRGVRDEGATECAAIHEEPRVLVKFFHVTAGKQLRALMAQAWLSHRAKPPAYQAVC